MKNSRMLFFLPLLLFSSCFKEDERIKPYDRGQVITDTIGMTQTYKYQVYYSLSDSTVVSQNNKGVFDLVFDNASGKAGVYPNSANFAKVARTGQYDLSAVSSIAGLSFGFDASSGNTDSLAFGNWFIVENTDTLWSNEVFVVDLGYDDVGNALGYRKVVIDSLVGGRYHFRYALLNNTETWSGTAAKSGSSNYIYFSFSTHEQVFPEPLREDYDLLFTQYTTLLYTNEGEPYPYIVTGVLLNRFQTQCYLDTNLVFQDINSENVRDQMLTSRPDIIGYDWKEVKGDVNTGNVYYEVRFGNNYFIKDQNGFYYKLRFAGFYNRSGEKGFPVIEFQKL